MSEAAFVRRTRRRTSSSHPGAGAVVTVLAAVATAGLLLYILAVTVILPWLRISRIHVYADFDISRQELLEQANLTGTMYYFTVRPSEIAARLEERSMIRSAAVEKVFPDSIRIDLTRRRPLALTMYSRDGRMIPAAIDEQGVIFDEGFHLAEIDLPVISGIEFQGSPAGSRMPEMLHPFLESLYRLQVDEPRLFDRLSELRVIPRRNGGFDVLLYTADYRIPVRLGSEITPESSRWSLMVLDVLAQQGVSGQVAEVDFRSGEIVYRMKEGADGR